MLKATISLVSIIIIAFGGLQGCATNQARAQETSNDKQGQSETLTSTIPQTDWKYYNINGKDILHYPDYVAIGPDKPAGAENKLEIWSEENRVLKVKCTKDSAAMIVFQSEGSTVPIFVGRKKGAFSIEINGYDRLTIEHDGTVRMSGSLEVSNRLYAQRLRVGSIEADELIVGQEDIGALAKKIAKLEERISILESKLESKADKGHPHPEYANENHTH